MSHCAIRMVLENLPRGVGKTFDPVSALLNRKVFDKLLEADVRIAAVGRAISCSRRAWSLVG